MRSIRHLGRCNQFGRSNLLRRVHPSCALTRNRPKSAMPTIKHCAKPIGRAFPRKRRNRSQASQQRPLQLRMWMKPKRLRQPLMRNGIGMLHAHPMCLLLRRQQRLLRS
ncbi:hypothetical protein TB9_09440 [Xanthomonas perforans]|nr:hypothetical protein XP816_14000 [Xanthomonas perforans]KLC55846.1 hypothetical protein XP2010_00475 [Xanthomonas perforans]KLD17823.1 hypothetical protein GEV1054_13430 [Xanthomonas perforans]KLD20493.1 hypothetical protein GEV1044_02540 [Xanthomonas perforans]KLD26738.1 hypothetical protein TB6_22200 [Xanthomonas perforans]